MNLSPDSLRYALVSQNILSGEGLSNPILWFDSPVSINIEKGLAPFVVQPPLYAILLSLFDGVFPDSYTAAQIVNGISLVVISTTSYLIYLEITKKYFESLTVALLILSSNPILLSASFISSELVFVSFIMLCIYFLIKARKYDFTYRYYLFAGFFAAAAIATRYTGVVLILLFAYEFFNKNSKNKSAIVVSSIIPIFMLSALLLRNYILSGTIRGFYQPSPNRTYLESFKGTLEMTFLQFDIQRSMMIAIIALGLILITLLLVKNKNDYKILSAQKNSGIDLIVIFILLYFMLIVYAMTNNQPRWEERFMIPLVPFIFIILVLTLQNTLKTFFQTQYKRIYVLFFFVLISIDIFIYINNYQRALEKTQNYTQFKNYDLLKWIKSHYADEKIVTTNAPFRLAFFGGYSTLRLPTKSWNAGFEIPENMIDVLPVHMDDVHSKLLVLFGKLSEKEFGTYIAQLSHKKRDDEHFQLLYSTGEGAVFILKK